MKIHQQANKLKVVLDRDQLFQMVVALSESPILKNRMLALEIKKAMDELNERGK